MCECMDPAWSLSPSSSWEAGAWEGEASSVTYVSNWQNGDLPDPELACFTSNLYCLSWNPSSSPGPHRPSWTRLPKARIPRLGQYDS